MKKFLTCMVLVSLYSCGGSSNKGAITQSAQSELKKEKEAPEKIEEEQNR